VAVSHSLAGVCVERTEIRTAFPRARRISVARISAAVEICDVVCWVPTSAVAVLLSITLPVIDVAQNGTLSIGRQSGSMRCTSHLCRMG